MAQTTLNVETVTKRRGETDVLREVSLSVSPGETVAILGPSGSGKTTLAELIAGILVPDSGRIRLNGVDITNQPPYRRRIPLAPQDWDLFPHLTALGNVEFGLRTAHRSKDARRKSALLLLEEIGLEDRINAYPHELSGGQQQRVGFARALAVPSEFLIVDEPFASVDQDTRVDLRTALDLAAKKGRGIIFITHDRMDALQMANRIVCLVSGKVLMTGTPEEVYKRPCSLDVALLTGDAFLFSPDTKNNQGPKQLLIRPEWIVLSSSEDRHSWRATVGNQHYQGDHYLVDFALGNQHGQLWSSNPLPLGATISIALKPDVAHTLQLN